MQNILRKYIRESLRRLLLKNGDLTKSELKVYAEITTLAGASIAGHMSSAADDKDDVEKLEDLKDKDGIAKSFGGGSYQE